MERTVKPRRNSEKRREKSRDAARQRRTQETNVFTELAQNLPLPDTKSSQLDKASIMRLTLATLKQAQIRSLFSDANNKNEVTKEEDLSALGQKTLSLYPKALDGFLLIISKEGEIIYLSEHVVKFLGIQQIELLGQNIFDYIHPCDHDELREMLSTKFHASEYDPYRRSFSVRMKCTLTNKGRNINIKSASYKVIKFSGKLTLPSEPNSLKENGNFMSYLFAFGEQIPHPSNIEVPLGHKTFLSQHSMDMKFTIWDEKIKELVGYSSEDIIGRPLYDYYHALDGEVIGKAFKDLMGKGQIMTEQYRFLAKKGGHVWVVTQATVIYDQRSHKSQYVVCVHYVLSEIQNRNEILSVVQQPRPDEIDEEIEEEEDVKEEIPLVVVEEKEVLTDPVQSPSEDSIPGPQLNTEKIFAPKTKEMEEELFAHCNTAIPVHKCLQDLTSRAPSAGDVCISLPFPAYPSNLKVTDTNLEMVKLKDEPNEGKNIYLWDSNKEFTFQQSPTVDLITPPSSDSEVQDFSKVTYTGSPSDPITASYEPCFSKDFSPVSCMENSPEATYSGSPSNPIRTSYEPCFSKDYSSGSGVDNSPEATYTGSPSDLNGTSYESCFSKEYSPGSCVTNSPEGEFDKSLYNREEWELKSVLFPDYKMEPYGKNDMVYNVNSPESPKKSPNPDSTNSIIDTQLLQEGAKLSHAKREIDISCLEKGPPEKKLKLESSPLPLNFNEDSFNSSLIDDEPNKDSVLRNLLVNGEDLNNGYSVNRPLTSPNFVNDLLCFDPKSVSPTSNRLLLPRLTQSDCDVNAPVPSNGLLNGNEILKALEEDTSIII